MPEKSEFSPKRLTDQDRRVGQRITALRKARGLSQTALGQAIGVTFQQVQKYEKGLNRVGAGRLQEIAQLLEVPVATLFAEGPETEGGRAPDPIGTPGARDLLHAYAAIPDEEVRGALVVLARALGRGGRPA